MRGLAGRPSPVVLRLKKGLAQRELLRVDRGPKIAVLQNANTDLYERRDYAQPRQDFRISILADDIEVLGQQ